jgi:hypothetical protein
LRGIESPFAQLDISAVVSSDSPRSATSCVVDAIPIRSNAAAVRL